MDEEEREKEEGRKKNKYKSSVEVNVWCLTNRPHSQSMRSGGARSVLNAGQHL